MGSNAPFLDSSKLLGNHITRGDVKRLFWDIETDGLLDTITKIHCIVMRDLDDETLVSQFFPPDFFTALSILENADEAWCHNGIAFDVPALRKILGWTGQAKVFDSMLASQLAFPDLIKRDYATHVPSGAMQKSMAGSHSIDAWGIRLGEIKVGADITDFSVLTPDLLARCIADTSIGVDVVRQCAERLPIQAWTIECALAPYLVQQEANGIAFDVEKAQALTAKLRGKQLALREDLAIWGGSWVTESGKPWIPKRDNVKLGYLKGVPVQKMKTVSFNPNSRPQIVKRLKEVYGWEPEVFTDANNPKLDEGVLLPLGAAMLQDGTPRYPIVQQMIEHFEVGKQLQYVSDGKTSWLKLVSSTTNPYRIHHHVNQLGTAYARASHSHPNLSQVPVLKDKQTGQDLPPTQQVFRELFYVPAPWLLVGSDLQGIELRALAHFAYPFDGGEYASIVLDGDPHAANAEAWGVSRTIAKTGIYAWLYGAGDKKFGRTLHPYLITERDQMAAGRKARAQIANRFVGLGRLVERVRDKASAQGFLTGLDGRAIPIRADYSALNNVLQTGAAVISKVWINNVNRVLTANLGPQGWDGRWAAQLYVHDELQLACGTEVAEYVRDTAIEQAAQAGKDLEFKVPVAANGNIGHNWSETH